MRECKPACYLTIGRWAHNRCMARTTSQLGLLAAALVVTGCSQAPAPIEPPPPPYGVWRNVGPNEFEAKYEYYATAPAAQGGGEVAKGKAARIQF